MVQTRNLRTFTASFNGFSVCLDMIKFSLVEYFIGYKLRANSGRNSSFTPFGWLLFSEIRKINSSRYTDIDTTTLLMDNMDFFFFLLFFSSYAASTPLSFWSL